jgi:hypothetical protein
LRSSSASEEVFAESDPELPAVPVVSPVPLAPLPEDCDDEAPWLMDDVEPTSVDCCDAVVPLVTDWLPLPTLMPGLTFADALRSVLLTPTFAFTPTFGFTFSVLPCAAVESVDEGMAPVPEEAAAPFVPDDCAALVLPPESELDPDCAPDVDAPGEVIAPCMDEDDCAVVFSCVAEELVVAPIVGLTFTVEPPTTVDEEAVAGWPTMARSVVVAVPGA